MPNKLSIIYERVVITMLEELEYILTEKTKTDMIYQELLQACVEAETIYNKIAPTLPAEKREAVERYLSACEVLEHRRTMLALSLAK